VHLDRIGGERTKQAVVALCLDGTGGRSERQWPELSSRGDGGQRLKLSSCGCLGARHDERRRTTRQHSLGELSRAH
jgi:hypothetical protein